MVAMPRAGLLVRWMETIVITAATATELSLLTGLPGVRELPQRGLRGVYELAVARKRLIFAVTGMGKTNAAIATILLIGRFFPALLVNTGCAGAYGLGGLAVGDLALATAEIYGDEGVLTPSGWQPLEFIGIPLLETGGRRFFNEFPLSPLAAAEAVRSAEMMGITLHAGRFVTVSTCSGTTRRGDEVARRFDAICETMEGAAIAHAALLHGVDCLEIRGVSNMVEDRDLSRWDLAGAAEVAQQFLRTFLEMP